MVALFGLLSLLAAALPSAALEGEKVGVRFFGESRCPFCRRFTTTSLADLISRPDVLSYVDLDYIPWGNGYFSSQECGGGPYDASERQCWAKSCVTETPDENVPDWCFAGPAVYQHGALEGTMDVYETCAKNLFGKLGRGWTFFHCVETEIDQQQSATQQTAETLVGTCAKRANISTSELEACVKKDGKALEISNAKATPPHPGVPWVLIDNQPLDDTDKLVATVCAKIEGAKPAGCASSSGKRTMDPAWMEAEALEGEALEVGGGPAVWV